MQLGSIHPRKRAARSISRTGVLAVAFAALAVGVVSAGTVSSGNTGWNWSNPLPQGNTITTSDAVNNRVYAAGANGAVLRSDNGGSEWTGVRSGILDDVRLIRAIGPDSFAFAAACALRRSDNGGATVRRLAWGPSDDSCSSEIASFHFASSSIGFLLLVNGEVLSTSDGGETWSKRTAVPETPIVGGAASPRDIHFLTGNVGVTSAGNKIFRTLDAGNSWTPVSTVAQLSSTGPAVSFEFVDSLTGFAVGGGDVFLRTDDGGASWTTLGSSGVTGPGGPTGGQPGDFLGRMSCATALNCLVSTSSGSRILRTTDGGQNWNSVSPSSRPIYTVATTIPNRAVAAGDGGETILTTDGGITWSPLARGVSGDYNGMNVRSTRDALIFGPRGNLARTEDGGGSWRALNVTTSANVLDAAFPTLNRGFVLDSLGAVLRTDTRGSSWRFLDTGVTTRPHALHAIDDSTVILIGPRGVLRSTNAGERFAPVGDRRFRRLALSKLDTAGKVLFAYGSRSIVTSTNGGLKWKSMLKPKQVSGIRKLDMVSSKTGYLLDTRNELWYTGTAGRKWVRIETTGGGTLNSMAFSSRTQGYLSSPDGRVLATDDAGRTWSRQYPFFDSTQRSPMTLAAPADRSAFMLVNGTNRVFTTTSGGKIGQPSELTIRSSSRRVRKKTVIRVTGKLTPAAGGERVTVLARAVGAKPGTRWAAQERTVSAAGTFTTSWRITKPTIFVARWSGDSSRDGDAAPAVRVLVRR